MLDPSLERGGRIQVADSFAAPQGSSVETRGFMEKRRLILPATVYEQPSNARQLVILVEHVCDRCGGQFETSELNSQENRILDPAGKWKTERTYRCFDCEREALLGQGPQ